MHSKNVSLKCQYCYNHDPLPVSKKFPKIIWSCPILLLYVCMAAVVTDVLCISLSSVLEFSCKLLRVIFDDPQFTYDP